MHKKHKEAQKIRDRTENQVTHPDGRPWSNDNGALRLTGGEAIGLVIHDADNVYNHKLGRVALFQGGDDQRAVRHRNGALYAEPFVPNNLDFAWQIYVSDEGVEFFNDYDGGVYLGYDAPTDQLVIVDMDDERRLVWKIDPAPSLEFSKPAPSRYYQQCDPGQPEVDVKKFTICVFRSEANLARIPTVGEADTGSNRLYFVSKGRLPVVDLHNIEGFRAVAPKTPDENYAWAIYGQLKIRNAGIYTLCIVSDDG